MRNLLLLALLFVCSCRVDDPNYQQGPQDDTTNWQDQYTYGGVLNPVQSPVESLSGTNWVITKYVSGFSTTFPNDTLKFISNNQYRINSGGIKPYQLTAGIGVSNKTLTLYYMTTFGGSHYSAQVGYDFISEGQINNAQFHNIENSTAIIRSWIIKL